VLQSAPSNTNLTKTRNRIRNKSGIKSLSVYQPSKPSTLVLLLSFSYFRVVLIIRLELIHDTFVYVSPDGNPQRWILHRGKGVHSFRALFGITGLVHMSLFHRLLRIHVVICRMSIRKDHRQTSPVGSEPARLNERQLNALFRPQLLAQRFGEPLHRISSAVVLNLL
jgi:hypothetical protein